MNPSIRPRREIIGIKIPDSIMLRAVPVNIQQVMMNLILNARDAIVPNNGTITIEAEEHDGLVRIIVRDTGAGIEPQNLDKIFDPFFSTKASSKDSCQPCGYGLGLAFCKKVIDEHGGTISVKSEAGVSTTFEINLPKSR